MWKHHIYKNNKSKEFFKKKKKINDSSSQTAAKHRCDPSPLPLRPHMEL